MEILYETGMACVKRFFSCCQKDMGVRFNSETWEVYYYQSWGDLSMEYEEGIVRELLEEGVGAANVERLFSARSTRCVAGFHPLRPALLFRGHPHPAISQTT